MCFGRRRGEVIGDKPGNTDSDPDSSEKAVPQGEGRTGLPLLPALRQDLPGGHPRPRLPVGESQWRCTGSGWPDIPGNRVEWVGEMAGWHQGRTTRKDVPAATGATGDDPEAWGRGKTARDTDHSGPSGADCRQAGAGADLRSGFRSECLWLSTETERAGRHPESASAFVQRLHRCGRCGSVQVLRYHSTLRTDAVRRKANRRSGGAASDKDVAQGPG